MHDDRPLKTKQLFPLTVIHCFRFSKTSRISLRFSHNFKIDSVLESCPQPLRLLSSNFHFRLNMRS